MKSIGSYSCAIARALDKISQCSFSTIFFGSGSKYIKEADDCFAFKPLEQFIFQNITARVMPLMTDSGQKLLRFFISRKHKGKIDDGVLHLIFHLLIILVHFLFTKRVLTLVALKILKYALSRVILVGRLAGSWIFFTCPSSFTRQKAKFLSTN
jgi:hypothetical protein